MNLKLLNEVSMKQFLFLLFIYVLSVASSTIPTVSHRTFTGGFFTLTQNIELNLNDDKLLKVGQLVISEIEEVTGKTSKIGDGSPANCTIYLSLLSNDPEKESYRMSIDSVIVIEGNSIKSIYWGTRTLLQLLKYSESIDKGIISDTPAVSERGLLVDVGRKYYSIGWLKTKIREMSYLKMNRLHLHLSDDQGFRIESKITPSIMSEVYYTKEEITDLITFAEDHFIEIIPEIDLPSHVGWMNSSFPQYVMGKDPNREVYFLDLSNDSARTFAQELIEEFIPLFPGKYWHLGADEYIGADNYKNYPQLEVYAKDRYGSEATGFDAYLGFIEDMRVALESQGKTVRTWADAYEYHKIYPNAPVKLSKSIIQELWNAWQDPREIITDGFTIQNASFHPTYYSLGGYRGDPEMIYDSWVPWDYLGGWERDGWEYPIAIDSTTAELIGSKLSIWSDLPESETEEEVSEKVTPLIVSLAEKCWGGNRSTLSYDSFSQLRDSLMFYSSDSNPIAKNNLMNNSRVCIRYRKNEIQLTDVKDFETLTVYSVRGRELLSYDITGNSGLIKMKITSLAAGLYYVKMSGKVTYLKPLIFK